MAKEDERLLTEEKIIEAMNSIKGAHYKLISMKPAFYAEVKAVCNAQLAKADKDFAKREEATIRAVGEWLEGKSFLYAGDDDKDYIAVIFEPLEVEALKQGKKIGQGGEDVNNK